MTEERVRIETIYESKWSYWKENSRVGERSLGYFREREIALATGLQYNERRGYHSHSASPTRALFVGRRAYKFEAVCPGSQLSLVNIDDLGNGLEELVAVEIRERTIVIVNSKPIILRRKVPKMRS